MKEALIGNRRRMMKQQQVRTRDISLISVGWNAGNPPQPGAPPVAVSGATVVTQQPANVVVVQQVQVKLLREKATS